MKIKILVMMLVGMLLLSPIAALGAAQTITVNYVIDSITDFSVSSSAGLTFSGDREDTSLAPDVGNPVLTIHNGATSVSQSFNVKLGTPNPTNVVLKIGSLADISDSVIVDTVAKTP